MSAQPQPVDPTAPVSVDGDPTGAGRIGVLLCHGFTSMPGSLAAWADHLVAAGRTVRLPLLPGHGTRWQELNRTGFDDWLTAVTVSLAELTRRCERVVVAGLSMGGTLALRLAELYPDSIDALVLVNPSVLSRDPRLRFLPVLKRVTPSVAAIGGDIAAPGVVEPAYARTPLRALDSLRHGWSTVRADLGKVRAPLLLLHSRIDDVVEPENARVVLDEVGSTDKTEIVLERSRHVATMDLDAELIFAETDTFLRRVCEVDR